MPPVSTLVRHITSGLADFGPAHKGSPVKEIVSLVQSRCEDEPRPTKASVVTALKDAVARKMIFHEEAAGLYKLMDPPAAGGDGNLAPSQEDPKEDGVEEAKADDEAPVDAKEPAAEPAAEAEPKAEEDSKPEEDAVDADGDVKLDDAEGKADGDKE